MPHNGEKFTLGVAAATRLFRGSFVDPQGVRRTFHGVLYPANQEGFGQFFGAMLAPAAGWTPAGCVEFDAN